MIGNLKNEMVRFRISDLYVPDPSTVLDMLYGSQILEGVVLDQTDSGAPDGAFVVIQVEGFDTPLIVPLQRILRVV